MGGGTFFKVGGDKPMSKKCMKILWFELETVTPQAFKYDVINFFQHVFKQFCAMLYKPSQHPLSTVHPIYLRYTDLRT